MSGRKHRVGVIGLGRVAYLLEQDPLRQKPCTHVGAWLSRDDVEIVAGCDIDGQRREEFAAAFPQGRVYTDYREMLEREGLDFLSICAYADTRAEMVIAAAAAGVRGIWCEKAMAASLAECDAMEAALDRSGTAMIVSYMRRWHPLYLRAKALLDGGTIGALESVNVHFSGNMLHTGTHAFDVMRMLAGDVSQVQAWLDAGVSVGPAAQSGYRFGDDGNVEDFGGFSLVHFENGVKGVVHGHDKEYFRFEFELLGSRGIIRIGNTGGELWVRKASDTCSGFHELHPDPFPEVGQGNPWQLAVDELMAAAENGAPVSCGLSDGRAALAIALAMHQSQGEGHGTFDIGAVSTRLRVPSR